MNRSTMFIKNKKGFTLVELLAVIVVLAIILGIAATRVVATINKSRTDSFVSSYKMVIRAVNNRLQLGASDISTLTCNDTAACASKYDLDISSDEYDLKVAASTNDLIVTMTGASGGKYSDIKITNNDVNNEYSLFNSNGGENNNSIATKININNGNTSKVTDANDEKIKTINKVMEKLISGDYIKKCAKPSDKVCKIEGYSNDIEIYNNNSMDSIFCTNTEEDNGYHAVGMKLSGVYSDSSNDENTSSGTLHFKNGYYNVNMNSNYCYADYIYGEFNHVYTCVKDGKVHADKIKYDNRYPCVNR